MKRTHCCTLIEILLYIIGERAKRARHSQVCSIENRGYIFYYIYDIYIYIPSNTFTPIEERVLNRIKYYPRSLDFMMIKSLP